MPNMLFRLHRISYAAPKIKPASLNWRGIIIVWLMQLYESAVLEIWHVESTVCELLCIQIWPNLDKQIKSYGVSKLLCVIDVNNALNSQKPVVMMILLTWHSCKTPLMTIKFGNFTGYMLCFRKMMISLPKTAGIGWFKALHPGSRREEAVDISKPVVGALVVEISPIFGIKPCNSQINQFNTQTDRSERFSLLPVTVVE